MPGAFFLLENLVAPALERGEAPFVAAYLAAVEPQRGTAQIAEKSPVMADDDKSRTNPSELVLQPLDYRKIEVVGGFVKEQDVGLGR